MEALSFKKKSILNLDRWRYLYSWAEVLWPLENSLVSYILSFCIEICIIEQRYFDQWKIHWNVVIFFLLIMPIFYLAHLLSLPVSITLPSCCSQPIIAPHRVVAVSCGHLLFYIPTRMNNKDNSLHNITLFLWWLFFKYISQIWIQGASQIRIKHRWKLDPCSWWVFCRLNKGLVWFGLVSLFNGISTFSRLFNAKAILLEEQ